MLTIIPPHRCHKQGAGGSRQLTVYPIFQVEPLYWSAWTIPGAGGTVQVHRIHISVSHVLVIRLSVAEVEAAKAVRTKING
jgi:hypothetical protein